MLNFLFILGKKGVAEPPNYNSTSETPHNPARAPHNPGAIF
jgi:hypothetical protein